MAREPNKKRALNKKASRFRKTVEIGSASQWDAFDLDMLHVDFDYKQFDNLKAMIVEDFYRTDSGSILDESIKISQRY